MRLINQKSLQNFVDVPYDRVWLAVGNNKVTAYDGIQNVILGKYSSHKNAVKAIEKLHTKIEQLGSITDYRIFVFPEDTEL
nr:hypothetical protein [uncultured Blautia sp.]